MKRIIVFYCILINLPLHAQEGFNLLASMSGDLTGDQFSVVSHIGYINVDGYDDVIVGAPGGDYVKLFYGGEVFDTIPNLIFRDYKEFNCQFGCSIAGGRDVNGDGYPDIIIGAKDTWIGPSCPYQCMRTGAAYVYFGGPNIDTTADLTLIVGNWLTQVGWYYEFGSAVTIPGDLNGDGYNDIVIGAPNDDYDAHGRAYIYFGGPDVDDQYDLLLEGEEVFDNLGQSLSAIGDLNDDGFDDVLIGAPMFHNNIPGKIYQGGKAYLVYGGNDINISNSIEFIGDTSSFYYGRFISDLGDVNGDSINDLGIMADEYFRIISGLDFQPLLITYADTNNFGTYYNIAAANDINNDGYNDILIILQEAISNEALNFVLVYYGGELIDSIPDLEITGGTDVIFKDAQCLGNINKDHYKDYIIGVQEWYGGITPGKGKVYIYSNGKINGIREEEQYNALENYKLLQNYPNPFNPTTTINYQLPQTGHVTLKIYDILGKEVTTLVNEQKTQGRYSVNFNASHLASGVYIYKIRVNDYISSKKMLLLK